VRIFEPFFSTKRIGAGSGLGLSICRNIINEFGGDIQVESEVEKGTRFVVRLPRWTEAAALRSVVPTSEAVALASLHGRILIVDDEDAGNLELDKPFGKDEFKDMVSGRIRAAKSEPPTRLDIPVSKRDDRS